METQAVTSATTTAPTSSTSSASAISSDFDTFLQMLSVQMQNQDPLNPIESTDFAVQLATFSSVEQQVLTNDLLVALSSQIALSNVAEMSAWVGQEVRAAMPTYFDGSPVDIAPNPAAIAENVELVVRDETGTEVQRYSIPVSAEPIQWEGVNDLGEPFPPGVYSFEVVSYAGGEVILQETADVYGVVNEVMSEGGEIILVMDGDVAVLASQVGALRAPTDSPS
ncbi:Basal-body rod modification protein FlgD [Flavimaricola marinus]|uniref:Basal-body rod modification protein FlgD n=2 Tax=Flavimaricola marinus TaxID=1819565 RepID=A0A238LH13_9RHOB|nr:Basal-body rod modification protein FlgD [Flavimaricola marinus]